MKINARQGGFTLVEIMIVVAIIALLASIAVPNFMRARLRTQAGLIKDELRLIDGAIDQYAIENNKQTTATVGWIDIKGYIKENSPLYTHGGSDSYGSLFPLSTIAAGVKVPAATNTALSDVASAEFWSPFVIGTN